MSPANPAFQVALDEVRGRMARGELRLPTVPGGRRDEVLVRTQEHVFIVPSSGRELQAISPRDRRRLEGLHMAACTGAVLVGSSWLVALFMFILGSAVVPALLVSGVAAILFAGSILLVPVLTSRPQPVGPAHPLAPEAESALWRALANGASGRPVLPRSEAPSVEPDSGGPRRDWNPDWAARWSTRPRTTPKVTPLASVQGLASRDPRPSVGWNSTGRGPSQVRRPAP